MAMLAEDSSSVPSAPSRWFTAARCGALIPFAGLSLGIELPCTSPHTQLKIILKSFKVICKCILSIVHLKINQQGSLRDRGSGSNLSFGTWLK